MLVRVRLEVHGLVAGEPGGGFAVSSTSWVPMVAASMRVAVAALLSWRGPGRELLFIDLDHFKNVNDTPGHDAGDTVFITAAQRLRHISRPEDTIVRLGVDEFVILLGVDAITDMAMHIAHRIVTTIN